MSGRRGKKKSLKNTDERRRKKQRQRRGRPELGRIKQFKMEMNNINGMLIGEREKSQWHWLRQPVDKLDEYYASLFCAIFRLILAPSPLSVVLNSFPQRKVIVWWRKCELNMNKLQWINCAKGEHLIKSMNNNELKHKNERTGRENTCLCGNEFFFSSLLTHICTDSLAHLS